jgi:hypothetical protein
MNMKVLCKCGHTGTVDLFGSDEAQEKRIAELELSDCTMCKKETKEKREAAQRKIQRRIGKLAKATQIERVQTPE